MDKLQLIQSKSNFIIGTSIKRVDALNDHLKYYPGSSYKDALEDFAKISNK